MDTGREQLGPLTRPERHLEEGTAVEHVDIAGAETQSFECGVCGRVASADDRDARRRSRLLAREAELFALQQQVNPHFLYNALETINSLANQERHDEVRAVVQRMAAIFRYCISRSPHETVRIEEELAHVRDYLAIQEMRFRDRLSVAWDVDPEVLGCQSVKFILQPLVENSLRHGFTDRASGAELAIRGQVVDGNVVLAVEDNGCGIEPARLEELSRSLLEADRRPLESGPSLGLRNVQSRIRLAFGARYGIWLDRRTGGGLRVVVRLPGGGEASGSAGPGDVRAAPGGGGQ